MSTRLVRDIPQGPTAGAFEIHSMSAPGSVRPGDPFPSAHVGKTEADERLRRQRSTGRTDLRRPWPRASSSAPTAGRTGRAGLPAL